MEMSDAQFEKRAFALIAQYADIIKKGFPEKELAKWNEKVDRLPGVAARTIRAEVEISNSLKDALMGREKPGHPKWRTHEEREQTERETKAREIPGHPGRGGSLSR